MGLGPTRARDLEVPDNRKPKTERNMCDVQASLLSRLETRQSDPASVISMFHLN